MKVQMDEDGLGRTINGEKTSFWGDTNFPPLNSVKVISQGLFSLKPDILGNLALV